MPRTFRERLALISGVDLEQLDGLETEERADLLEFEPNLARLVKFIYYSKSKIDNYSMITILTICNFITNITICTVA